MCTRNGGNARTCAFTCARIVQACTMKCSRQHVGRSPRSCTLMCDNFDTADDTADIPTVQSSVAVTTTATSTSTTAATTTPSTTQTSTTNTPITATTFSVTASSQTTATTTPGCTNTCEACPEMEVREYFIHKYLIYKNCSGKPADIPNLCTNHITHLLSASTYQTLTTKLITYEPAMNMPDF